MDDIASKAGVATQTVYAHFSTKRDLFVSMVSTLSNQASDRAHIDAPEFRDTDDLEHYLRDYAIRQLEIVLTAPIVRLRRLVIGDLASFLIDKH